MQTKILITTLLILGLNPLAAYACPTGNPSSLAYIRRDENRCEGIRDQNASSNTLSLVSFYTTTLTNYPDALNIRVPGTGGTSPEITIQSEYRNYQLDQLSLRSASSEYTFSLNPSTVLRPADVPFGSLQAVAFIRRDSSLVYFPLILNTASSAYKFTFYSPQRTTFPVVEIRRNGQVQFSNPITVAKSGYIQVTWQFGNAPTGLYELYIETEEGDSRTFRFEHNPDWLS